jgi:hypothetical protein
MAAKRAGEMIATLAPIETLSCENATGFYRSSQPFDISIPIELLKKYCMRA